MHDANGSSEILGWQTKAVWDTGGTPNHVRLGIVCDSAGRTEILLTPDDAERLAVALQVRASQVRRGEYVQPPITTEG